MVVQRDSSCVSELIDSLIEGRRAVFFVTGATLSTSSGLPPFKESSLASEELKTLEAKYAEQEAYDKDPLEWWNSFWLPLYHNSPARVDAPNLGHIALAYIAEHFARVHAVTQCIDPLHMEAGIPQAQLKHAYGDPTRYKCLGKCGSVSSEIGLASAQLQRESIDESLSSLPRCSQCGGDIVPAPAFTSPDWKFPDDADVILVGNPDEVLNRMCISKASKVRESNGLRVFLLGESFVKDGDISKTVRWIRGPPCELLAVLASTLERLGELEGKHMKSWSSYSANAALPVSREKNRWVAGLVQSNAKQKEVVSIERKAKLQQSPRRRTERKSKLLRREPGKKRKAAGDGHPVKTRSKRKRRSKKEDVAAMPKRRSKRLRSASSNAKVSKEKPTRKRGRKTASKSKARKRKQPRSNEEAADILATLADI